MNTRPQPAPYHPHVSLLGSSQHRHHNIPRTHILIWSSFAHIQRCDLFYVWFIPVKNLGFHVFHSHGNWATSKTLTFSALALNCSSVWPRRPLPWQAPHNMTPQICDAWQRLCIVVWTKEAGLMVESDWWTRLDWLGGDTRLRLQDICK